MEQGVTHDDSTFEQDCIALDQYRGKPRRSRDGAASIVAYECLMRRIGRES